MTFETSKIALFNKEKISFWLDYSGKTTRNVICFQRLKSGIILLNIQLQIVKNHSSKFLGEWFCYVYIMQVKRRSVTARLSRLTRSKFVKNRPYTIKRALKSPSLQHSYFWQFQKSLKFHKVRACHFDAKKESRHYGILFVICLNFHNQTDLKSPFSILIICVKLQLFKMPKSNRN